ncbi:Zinc finger CCHC domain-containing protein 9 [Liparis tanakae]|uniref:Zinc finger CCHC domain-containing protein 9 n=1 Tax=Liparis tanakae TaxID=230148 RepID=A0A4Z2FIT8_9TELE|nr:Zinc finger CCHC domain-containing protein 9 [Liparis tanakae]
MTRWARANNIHKHKPAEATPWTHLRGGGGAAGAAGAAGGGAGGGAGGAGGGPAGPAPSGSSTSGPQRDRLRGPRLGGSAVKKPNRPKKEYVSDDVNGFLEFLQQSGRPLPRGGGGGGGGGGGLELREELETALKKDRRREDRRVKRQDNKKSNMLCFNCRKPGHGLADCPEAELDEEAGRDICYRCGSTEHEIHKCRAKVDPALGEYPYAKCFICSKTGHLSRSCPDNPKGLYAQGGACRVCGSVEHFQKDCPEHQATTNAVTLPWLSNNMSADHEDVHLPVKEPKPKATKVVMF